MTIEKTSMFSGADIRTVPYAMSKKPYRAYPTASPSVWAIWAASASRSVAKAKPPPKGTNVMGFH
jgi:hypothetical protein